MITNQATVQTIVQPDFIGEHNTIHLAAALQSELAVLQSKVINYYHSDIVARGDKVLMREYCEHFNL